MGAIVCMRSSGPLANSIDQVWRSFEKKQKQKKMKGGKMQRGASESNHITDDFTVQPSPAFTSGLLKMISAHGGQALAFAFYWKH